MLPPTLHILPERKLIGMRIQTTLADHKAALAWRAFRPRVRELTQRLGTDFFAVQQYPHTFGSEAFTPFTAFDTWATVEVSDFTPLPDGMEPLTLPGGLYAAFVYQGLPSGFPQVAQYIYGEWLPASGYALDNSRPHFETLGADYQPTDPQAQETIRVPVVWVG